MKKGRTILRIVIIIVELLLFMAILICPFTKMLGIPGIVWKFIIGMIGCIMLAMGIRKKAKCIYEAT